MGNKKMKLALPYKFDEVLFLKISLMFKFEQSIHLIMKNKY
jgi:hypothetical protein